MTSVKKNSEINSCWHIGGIKFRMILGVVLCALVFWLSGCGSWEQPGETSAEKRRRHKRNLRMNKQEMMADIDKALMFDEPSKLSDKRIP